jgi:DNA-directed RNA polymerase sigma subunit (sigma70/sigma32)
VTDRQKLAEAVEAGNEAVELLEDSVRESADGLERLAHIVDHGDEAHRRLVESNLRLVVSVARRCHC